MCWCVLLIALQFSQSAAGELRLTVTDPGGLPLQSHVVLVSEANQLTQRLETDAEGALVARRLPFGRYRIEIARDGFATFARLFDIDSALPSDLRIVLSLAPVESQVTVSPEETLLDSTRTSAVNRIGAVTLQRRLAALPGRSVSDVVTTQPGWLLEANGILHPRGSEYQVQFVVDGLPITDNRSPAFAPELDVDDVHAMSILTAGYPAEYGRKLGGVVEVVTAGEARLGFHGSASGAVGSFGTVSGYGLAQYGWRRTTVGVSADVSHTDRYLDPPVEENFTNNGTGTNVAVHVEHGFSDADRLGVILRRGGTSFSVPNERVQEEAGQRQERTGSEPAAQVSYQHIFSTRVLADVRFMFRSLGGALTSNESSTPIVAAQDRGFRETYVKGTVSVQAGRHEWKAGADVDMATIREQFNYRLTDPDRFDPGTPLALSFADRRSDREQALFVQDRARLGAWTINAGLRWDRYRLLVDESAFSPRFGVAWSPTADLVLRASYDRAFQTPAIENLLLASAPALDRIGESVVRLPLRPSLGHFVEGGLSMRLFGAMRLDVTAFSRRLTNFADDDVLLNTGVSFPIAFASARIHGLEAKLEMPRRGGFSGFVSYANLTGVGSLPITGGLLVGDEAAAGLTGTDTFPISQDQRHTISSRVTYDLSPRAWIAGALSYGSGLPVEFNGDRDEAVEQYGERIVERVNFDEGRVRPFASLAASVGVTLRNAGTRRIVVQADATNLTNHLNVVNFAGLFSGTAVAAPRAFAIRLRTEF